MSELSTEEAAAPVACTLGSRRLATQVERWRKLYARAGTERVVTDEGLRICFRRAPAVEHELRQLVAAEVDCCRWADWTVEAKTDELVLDISSTGDGIAVIHSWFLAEQPVLTAARR
jgi:hypothetical protein